MRDFSQMTEAEKEAYFVTWDKEWGGTKAWDDLIAGRLHIYEVPYEYRENTAYIMACRWARAKKDEVEIDLIRHTLLHDLMESTGSSIHESLRDIYQEYFVEDCIHRMSEMFTEED